MLVWDSFANLRKDKYGLIDRDNRSVRNMLTACRFLSANGRMVIQRIRNSKMNRLDMQMCWNEHRLNNHSQWTWTILRSSWLIQLKMFCFITCCLEMLGFDLGLSVPSAVINHH